MWQHQCHICRNETTGVIDEEEGCENCIVAQEPDPSNLIHDAAMD